jgi:hypothetical protein
MHVKHVWCSPNGGPGELGHIVRSSYTDANGDTKSDVLVGDTVHALGYREPADRDANGAGGTFWNIVDEEGSNQ